VRVGIVAGDGGAVIWLLLIGPHRAKEFLMRGNFINGAEAAKIGMVNYAVAPDQVMGKARELAQELADGPTWAIRWSKLAVNKWLKQQAKPDSGRVARIRNDDLWHGRSERSRACVRREAQT
jgi:enoyl-CoA hydratase